MNALTPFGFFIRELRIRDNMTLLKMAHKLKLGVCEASAMERGKYLITEEIIDSLSKMFQVEREKLIKLAAEGITLPKGSFIDGVLSPLDKIKIQEIINKWGKDEINP